MAESKVILTDEQIPEFLNVVRQAVNMQIIQQTTVGEAKAFVQGASLVFMAMEQALAGRSKDTSSDEGLPRNGKQ
jgi:hypothetical protein